jgi:hypothetical protein
MLFLCVKKSENVLRATMCQDKISSLEVLAVEKELAKNINLDAVINDFAMKKTRKGTF